MKNIHILPTDKPSRLFIHNAFNDLRLDDENVLHDNNQNIYITSDEEIKEGDYAIYLFRNAVQKIQIGINFSDKTAHKKIILTTDQELIKEGVQAIDDDFLEWFVKNPRCESVEVDKNWNYPLDKTWEYKIIIPKEEPKDVVLGYKTSGYWYKSKHDEKGNEIYWENSNGDWQKSEYDEKGNRIYWEDSDGDWRKSEYDEKGNRIYIEDSNGGIVDNRPKVVEIEGIKYKLVKL